MVFYLLTSVRGSTKDDKFSASSDLCFTNFLASKSHDKVHSTVRENHVRLNVWCVLIRNRRSVLDPGLKYAEVTLWLGGFAKSTVSIDLRENLCPGLLSHSPLGWGKVRETHSR